MNEQDSGREMIVNETALFYNVTRTEARNRKRFSQAGRERNILLEQNQWFHLANATVRLRILLITHLEIYHSSIY